MEEINLLLMFYNKVQYGLWSEFFLLTCLVEIASQYTCNFTTTKAHIRHGVQPNLFIR